MKQDGIDLKSESTIVYGAPPLLAAKILSGEMDATVNYWNFCAALEAKGLRRLIGIEDLLSKLGAKGRTAMIGYVFDEGWESANRGAVSRFVAMTRAAKEILAASDAEWEKIAPLTGATDAATCAPTAIAIGKEFRAGRSPKEEADARVLYRVLRRSAVAKIVGAAQELDPGTFYRAIPETEMLRLLSFTVFLATWWIAALLAGADKLPPPSRRADGDYYRSQFGGAVLQSRRDTGARCPRLHIGDDSRDLHRLSHGPGATCQPTRRSLADPAAQPAGARRYRACVYLGPD